MTTDFQKTHFALMDLQYAYLDDGYTIVATTDVPCHLYCRMTKEPPLKHTLPSTQRGTRFTGDVRFCFTVFEDNDQVEAGDTTEHTFIKDDWPVCQDRWFYFVGEIDGVPVVSETAIFKFHFPAPPPYPPDPIYREYWASEDNRALTFSWGAWNIAHDAANGNILTNYLAPWYVILAGDQLTASYFIYRGFLDFDTTALPSTTKVISATLSVYVESVFPSPFTKPNLYITQGRQGLPPVAANYGGQIPFVDVLGSADLSTFTPNAYNDIPFNDYGLNFITPSSVTRFCLRGQRDVEDHASVPVYNSFVRFYSQQKGSPYQPKLKINYLPAERIC